MTDQAMHVLVVVDDSEGATKAVAYVAKIMRGREDSKLVLFHLLPPPPRALGGFSDPDDRANGEGSAPELEQARGDWDRRAAAAAEPILQRSRSVLLNGGFAPEDIRTECRPSGKDEHPADLIVAAATARGCETIVVGRRTYPWFLDLFQRKLERALVKRSRGHVLWVVD